MWDWSGQYFAKMWTRVRCLFFWRTVYFTDRVNTFAVTACVGLQFIRTTVRSLVSMRIRLTDVVSMDEPAHTDTRVMLSYSPSSPGNGWLQWRVSTAFCLLLPPKQKLCIFSPVLWLTHAAPLQDSRIVFTWITIVLNFIPIRFETTEP